MILDNSLTHVPTPSPAATLPACLKASGCWSSPGLIGPVLSAILTIIYLIHGPVISREGVLLKPIESELALGLFIINTALVMPLAGFKGAGRVASNFPFQRLAVRNLVLH